MAKSYTLPREVDPTYKFHRYLKKRFRGPYKIKIGDQPTGEQQPQTNTVATQTESRIILGAALTVLPQQTSANEERKLLM